MGYNWPSIRTIRRGLYLGLPRTWGLPRTPEQFSGAAIPRRTVLRSASESSGARADNNLLAMVEEFAAPIHFVHLRQVRREADGSFHEAEHLAGDSDMVGVVLRVLAEERRRRNAGRPDHEIPMRPDHGQLLADDIHKKSYPGYSLIGRLKGLAGLRGVIRGLKYAVPELADRD